MKTRLLPAVLLVSLLVPVALLRAASDVSVSSAPTIDGTFGGGNPNVFTPTANSAVANNATIQTSLNAGTSVTLNTASAATGSGDFQIAAPVSKTVGSSSTLTLNAVRNLAINAAISASGGPLPLVLNAGGAISSSASIAANGGNITINTAQTFTLGSSLNAGTGQILLQTGSLESSAAQTATASTVQVSAGATWRQRGTVAGSLNVAGTVSPGAQGLTSLQVNSALTLQSTATTIVNLGGTSQGNNYGRLTATGAVTLAGALQVDFANGFENSIVNSNTFTILSGASITGRFAGLPNSGDRIVFPNELGSVKITYTATAVTLSDWQPYIRELTWDPGTADTGTQVLTNTSTRAGRHYFHINTQATDIGAWKTRLTVATGEADLYLSLTAVPQTTAGIPASPKSERTGSDGLVLRSDDFAAGQDWYLLVNVPTAGAQWSIFTGRAWVQDLGTLA